MDKVRKQKLRKLEKILKIRFKDMNLLDKALTHTSYAHEILNNEEHYEKLEFLGDSVLSLVINEYLYNSLKNEPVGQLSRLKSLIVSDSSLYKLSEKLGLGAFLNLGKGEQQSGGNHKSSLLADIVESIIGAYYMDAGLKKVKKFILWMLTETIEWSMNIEEKKDSKSKLQEYMQKQYKISPEYYIIEVKGPEHNRVYEIGVRMNDRELGRGLASNKKDAEKIAAKNALYNLKKK